MNDEQKARNASPTAAILRQAIAAIAAQIGDEVIAQLCDPGSVSAYSSEDRHRATFGLSRALGKYVARNSDPVNELRTTYAAFVRQDIVDAIERSIKEGVALPDPEAKWSAKVARVRFTLERASDELTGAEDSARGDAVLDVGEVRGRADGLRAALRILEAP